MSARPVAKSGAKGTKAKWDEEAHKALVGALLDVVEAETVSIRKPANQAILVASMEERGHKATWEAIRYVLSLVLQLW